MESLQPVEALDIPRDAQRVLCLLEAAEFEAYVVGGCVRDALLGLEPNDWDICTQATPDQVKRVMAQAGVKTADTGIKHGTVSVIFGSTAYETTTYRSDGAYSDGRHPDDVRFLDRIDGDLARRDFTVNAMAYSPHRGLVDRFGGREDLAAGVLRAVGEPPVRFQEDALRIMRALRFSATYGLQIEPQTAKALHECRHLLEHVSSERIWAELSRLLCGAGAVGVLREFRDVIAVVVPELEATFDFDQHNPFHHFDVWEHTLHALQAAPADMPADLRFAVLLHDIAKPQCLTFDEDGIGHMYGHDKAAEPVVRGICARLRMPNAAKDTVVHAVRWHMFSIPDTPKSMRRFLLKHGAQGTRDLFAVRECDIAGFGHPIPPDAPMSIAFARAKELLEEQLNAQPVFGVADLAIGGRDLLAAGVPQGPQVGEMLRSLLEQVVDGGLENSREVLLAAVGEWAGR